MPLFEYKCKSCGKSFEELVWGDRDRAVPCPSCGSLENEKLMSVIGGIAMKGSTPVPSCGQSSCASAAACASSGGACCPHAM